MDVKRRAAVKLLGVAGPVLWMPAALLAQTRVGDRSGSITLASAINMAGRQRMLSQRIPKAYAQLTLDVMPEQSLRILDESVRLFDTQLSELTKFAPSAGTRQIFVRQGRLWKQYRDLLGSAPNRQTVASIQALDDEMLLAAHNGAVGLEKLAGTLSGKLVNISGRQRMLSQRLAKFYMFRELGLAGPLDDSIRETKDKFAAALRGLLAAKDTTPKIRSLLLRAAAQWLSFEGALDVHSGSKPDPAARLNVATGSELMLEMFESITKVYEEISAPV